jgi:hypothetical protein
MQAQSNRRSGHQRTAAWPRRRHRPGLAAAALSVTTALVLSSCDSPPPPGPPGIPASSTPAASDNAVTPTASGTANGQITSNVTHHQHPKIHLTDRERAYAAAVHRLGRGLPGWRRHSAPPRLARLEASTGRWLCRVLRRGVTPVRISNKAGEDSKGTITLDDSQVSLAAAVHIYCPGFRTELETSWRPTVWHSHGFGRGHLPLLHKLTAYLVGNDD